MNQTVSKVGVAIVTIPYHYKVYLKSVTFDVFLTY